MSSGLIHLLVPPLVCELEVVVYPRSETIVRSPKSARHACPCLSTRMLTLYGKNQLGNRIAAYELGDTPPLDPHGSLPGCEYTPILLQHPGATQVVISEEWDMQRNGNPTSSKRFTSLWALINSLILPFDIHSDTIANCISFIVTPSSGNKFGW